MNQTVLHLSPQSPEGSGPQFGTSIKDGTLSVRPQAQEPTALCKEIVQQLSLHAGNPAISRWEISFAGVKGVTTDDAAAIIGRFSGWLRGDRAEARSVMLRDLAPDLSEKLKVMQIHKLVELHQAAAVVDLDATRIPSHLNHRPQLPPSLASEAVRARPQFEISEDQGSTHLRFSHRKLGHEEISEAARALGTDLPRLVVDLSNYQQIGRTEAMTLSLLTKRLAPDGILAIVSPEGSLVRQTFGTLPPAMLKRIELTAPEA